MSNSNVPKVRTSLSTPDSAVDCDPSFQFTALTASSEQQQGGGAMPSFAFASTPTDSKLEALSSAPKIQAGGQYEFPAAGGVRSSSGSGGIAAQDRPRGSKPSLLGSLESGDHYDDDMGSGRERVTLGQMAEQVQANARAFALASNGDESDDGAGGGDESYDRVGTGAGLTDDDEGVCQPGHEQTGRWTRKEHELFLEALKKHGKEWKKVASAVKTRTVVQTRTHAQKYFQKATKSSGGRYPGGGLSDDDDGMGPSGAGASGGGGAKRSSGRKTRRTSDPSRRGAAASSDNEDYYDNADEYDEPAPATTPLVAAHKTLHISVSRLPEDFPQPSPAACGKRKVAEMTAAQMLAGSSAKQDIQGAQVLSTLKAAPLRPGEIVRRARGASALTIINPDAFEHAGSPSSNPGTPWDREIGQLVHGRGGRMHLGASPRGLGVSTPSEQRDFLGKVLSYVRAGDLGELTQILVAAEASSASLMGSTVVAALDMQQSEASPNAGGQGSSGGAGGGVSSNNSSSSSSSSSSGSSSSGSSSSSEGSSSKSSGGSSAGADDAPSSQSKPASSASNSIVARTLNRMSSQGRTCLVEACALDPLVGDQALVLAICRLLMDHGASAAVLDAAGTSCLHHAAAAGFEKVGKLLLNQGCPINAVRADGNAAIHLAAQHGHGRFLEMLADMGANCHLRNAQARAAIDLCGESAATSPAGRAELRRIMLSVEPRLRTLVLYHEDCLEHSTRKMTDWEGPDRLMGIMTRLQDRHEFPEHELEVSTQFDKAAVELLSRVHSPEYIAFVDRLSKKLQMESGERVEAVAFTPHVQKAMLMSKDEELKRPEFADTSFSSGTLRAARRAAGAVAHAVDRVLLGRNRNAFCVVRPPGHHAGYRGLLDGAKSCGFCIFNSVAAGAVHALEGHSCGRVAIIDLDIHHGNGTEDIVRRYPNPSRLLFFSLHLYDKDSMPGYEFFPGSGASDDTVHNIINVPIMPIWRGEGKEAKADAPKALVGREAYRQAITQRLLPSLRAFNPDLILLSTGFDPVDGDVGNTRSGTADGEPGMDLRPEDFEWVTSEILHVADICCAGRVVSVLEGGYGKYSSAEPKAAPRPSRATRNTAFASPTEDGLSQDSMDRNILASAAAAHVHCLVDPYAAWASSKGAAPL